MIRDLRLLVSLSWLKVPLTTSLWVGIGVPVCLNQCANIMGDSEFGIIVNDTVSHTTFKSYTHTASVTEFNLSSGDTVKYILIYEGDGKGGIDSIDVKLCGVG
ncbi:hypothetical protein QUF90_21650 [Desulfococcaceae bacterium HSG9]|nr:hypothetical protein [Desulfococcaceae bacterium HSG9]